MTKVPFKVDYKRVIERAKRMQVVVSEDDISDVLREFRDGKWALQGMWEYINHVIDFWIKAVLERKGGKQ